MKNNSDTMNSSGRRRLARKGLFAAVAGAAAVAVLSAGVAFAYWQSSGSGTASAQAGTASPVTLAAGTVSTLLYPGATGDVATLVTNPNPYPVLISGLSAGTITSNVTACNTGGHGVTFNVPSSYPSGTYRVPAKAGTSGGPAAFAITISGGASMAITSDNACQGATFTIPLTGTATATS